MANLDSRSKTSRLKDSAGKTAALGEVISASITEVTIEAWTKDDQLEGADRPRFGSYLATDSTDGVAIICVVYDVITGPPDSVHLPAALGLTREELRRQQPHIFSLLRTQIHAAVIGYKKNGKVFQHLPPQPADVHDFVAPASPEDVESIAEGFGFLRLLLNISKVPSDELLAAAIREAHSQIGGDDSFFLEAGRSMSHIFRNDYDRLVCILKKIRPDP